MNLINVHPSKEEEFYLHSIISNGTKLKNIEELSAAGNWLLKIREANNISKILDTFYLDKILTERWLRSCYVLFPGVKGFSLFLKSTIFANVRFKVRIFYHLIISLLRAWKRKNLK